MKQFQLRRILFPGITGVYEKRYKTTEANASDCLTGLWHWNENKATPGFTYLGSIEVSKNRTESISPNKARRCFADGESSCRFSSVRDPNIRGYRWAPSRTECFSSMHFSQLNIWILKFHPRIACISWIWTVINISSHYFVTNLQKIVHGFISKQELFT